MYLLLKGLQRLFSSVSFLQSWRRNISDSLGEPAATPSPDEQKVEEMERYQYYGESKPLVHQIPISNRAFNISIYNICKVCPTADTPESDKYINTSKKNNISPSEGITLTFSKSGIQGQHNVYLAQLFRQTLKIISSITANFRNNGQIFKHLVSLCIEKWMDTILAIESILPEQLYIRFFFRFFLRPLVYKLGFVGMKILYCLGKIKFGIIISSFNFSVDLFDLFFGKEILAAIEDSGDTIWDQIVLRGRREWYALIVAVEGIFIRQLDYEGHNQEATRSFLYRLGVFVLRRISSFVTSRLGLFEVVVLEELVCTVGDIFDVVTGKKHIQSP